MSVAVEAADGRVLYRTVTEAFRVAGIPYKAGNKQAVLLWYDTIHDGDYFSKLKPYQIVNRIPAVNVICRKAPFIRLIQRMQPYFPNLYTFLPKSYILPEQNDEFLVAVAKNDRRHIVKPDNGALGAGIKVIEPGQTYKPTKSLGIAQEYVESCLVDSTKFDCRIYALIASVTPLKLFVYRGGVARFCSKKSSEGSVYSQLTNTAVNRKNPEADINKITRMVTDVFEVLRGQGVDTDKLWQRIDSAIVLTILSAYGYISEAEIRQCPASIYPRCFQILGFDVLIDENYNPTILEVNYRPSLNSDTAAERDMKVDMLSSAMKIVTPVGDVQQRAKDAKEPLTEASWKSTLNRDPQLVAKLNKQIGTAEYGGSFVQVFPGKHPDYSKWLNVYDRVRIMPTGFEKANKMPVMVIGPKDAVIPTGTLSVHIVSQPTKNESLSENVNPISPMETVEAVIAKPKAGVTHGLSQTIEPLEPVPHAAITNSPTVVGSVLAEKAVALASKPAPTKALIRKTRPNITKPVLANRKRVP